ncbi:hypothetical protein RBU49_01740 [Clostridium sp. MB40-C1]|uniref:hypothetical protein n=1 Tax=Clostridium sp. MB40-C1 TaxID=3070996 RepID=UPI0027DF1903|nr:hypothetical protein [Clostridium sp. MB40-C1]WMJ81001.1 hypothetical protein RBU49_01740 [Clostridium sp. MB40-C1]
MKRRIIYKENKLNKETEIICIELADKLEDVELKILDLDYEQDKDKFDRVKKMHIENGKIVFDELYPDVNKELQKELLDTQEIIINQKYKELVGGLKDETI